MMVFIGSYLWLVAPSILAYYHIKAIAEVELSQENLKNDLGILNRYNEWRCIPARIAKDPRFNTELVELRDVLNRYDNYIQWNPVPAPADSSSSCDEPDSLKLPGYWAYWTIERIDTIRAARIFMANDKTLLTNLNDFYIIHLSFVTFIYVAIMVSILTVIFSYPRYFWRRTLLRQ